MLRCTRTESWTVLSGSETTDNTISFPPLNIDGTEIHETRIRQVRTRKTEEAKQLKIGGQNRDGKGARQFATFQSQVIPLPHQEWGRQTEDKRRATNTRREGEEKQWGMKFFYLSYSQFEATVICQS